MPSRCGRAKLDFYLFYSGINLSTAVLFDCFKDGGGGGGVTFSDV
jgi:hypothetical protein